MFGSGTTLLDGGMATALPGGAEMPEAILLSRPELVEAVHAAHVAAGARVLLTATFNCTAPRLGPRGLDARLEAFCGWAVQLARHAARGKGALVAGGVGPTALVRVEHGRRAGPGLAELRPHFDRPMRALAVAGADLLWTESHYDLDEARAALAAALATGKPAAATLALKLDGGAWTVPSTGLPAAEALRALASDGAAAVGVNCVAAGPELAALAAAVAPSLPVPLVVKPHAGLPGALVAPGPWAEAVAAAAKAGARLVGGCCAATAEHLAALQRNLQLQVRLG